MQEEKNLPLVRSFIACFVSIIFFTRYIVTTPATKDVTIVPLIVVVDDDEEEDILLSCILSLEESLLLPLPFCFV